MLGDLPEEKITGILMIEEAAIAPNESPCAQPGGGGPLTYAFDRTEFWRAIPAWRDVDTETFGDFRWQQRNSVTSIQGIQEALGELAKPALIADIEAGLLKTPMNVRLTPYIFSRIHWGNVEDDPVRRQFLPLGSQFVPDHPHVMDDSLAEDSNKATPHLTHRYPDKALFLPITLCPVYCSFCTRSRVVGGSTAVKSKSTYGAKSTEWDATFDYIRSQSELEDIVISGGDALLLRPNQIRQIGTTLLEIPTVRRIRFATKGLAIMPMKFTSDTEWVEVLGEVCQLGRERMKEVALHTHFNTDREITAWTARAMEALATTGVRVRNQSVLISGVNDGFDCLHYTNKKLSSLLVQPYYVYLHDMVPGCEHLRTTVDRAEYLSRRLQGSIAGFNTPRVVCDAPGGGGQAGDFQLHVVRPGNRRVRVDLAHGQAGRNLLLLRPHPPPAGGWPSAVGQRGQDQTPLGQVQIRSRGQGRSHPPLTPSRDTDRTDFRGLISNSENLVSFASNFINSKVAKAR